MDEKTVSSKKVYESSFLTMYEDQVLLENGMKSQRVYVKHIGAAAVLPITKDGKIILTKQFRYPVKKVTIEIPAGKKDEIDERGIDCIKRELEEETGYQSNDIRHVYDIHNCLGYSDELIEMFIAYDCFEVENPLESDPDEFIEIELYEIDVLKEMIKKNEITDVKTILMIQNYILNG